MAQTHEPTHVIGYLEGGRVLATNEAQDLYFVIEADGGFRRVDAAAAAALFHQRVPREEANQRRKEQLARNLQQRLLAERDTRKERAKQLRKERRAKMREERRAKMREEGITVPTKHIRIADKKRELEQKIQELEARLAKAQAGSESAGEHRSEEDEES